MKYYFSRVETALSGHPDNSPVRPASETRVPLNIAIDQAWCLNGYGYNSIAGRHLDWVPSNWPGGPGAGPSPVWARCRPGLRGIHFLIERKEVSR